MAQNLRSFLIEVLNQKAFAGSYLTHAHFIILYKREEKTQKVIFLVISWACAPARKYMVIIIYYDNALSLLAGLKFMRAAEAQNSSPVFEVVQLEAREHGIFIILWDLSRLGSAK